MTSNDAIEVNINTKSDSKKDSAVEIIKFITSLLLSGLVGAGVTGLFQIYLEKERRQTEILLRVFEVSKYANNQKDSGKLDADAFADNIELLVLGKFFKDNPPDIDEIRKTSQKILNRVWTKAAQYEALGFQALLEQNLSKAKIYFQKSYDAYDTYHHVDEINTMIKNKSSVSNWNSEVYCPIKRKSYDFYMPQELKEKMQNIVKNSCL